MKTPITRALSDTTNLNPIPADIRRLRSSSIQGLLLNYYIQNQGKSLIEALKYKKQITHIEAKKGSITILLVRLLKVWSSFGQSKLK